jgi:tRNA pseudouridine38-40 synthase
MNAVARIFAGEHDFAAFRSLGSEEKSTVRTVFASEWRRERDVLIYRVEATAFLRRMVRTLAATMVEAGRGRLTSADAAALIAARDRARVPAAAPACGLYLMEVRY